MHTLQKYFLKLASEFPTLNFTVLSSYRRLLLSDRRDQSSSLDKIVAVSTGRAIDNNSIFKGFCKISSKKFYAKLSSRTNAFNYIERTKLKSTAAQSQLTSFTETISAKTLDKASKLVSKHLGLDRKRFKPAKFDEAVASLKLQKSSGWPWLAKKESVLEEIIEWTKYYLDPEKWNPTQLLKFPTYIAYRVQQRPSAVKLRLIYVYSAVIVIMEQLFLVPLIKYFLNNKEQPYVIGNVGSDLVRKWNRWQSRNRCVSIDWSGFDWSASRLLMMRSFSIIKESFILDTFSSSVFDFVSYYFINTPIITNRYDNSPLEVVTKRRGVPSGSSFTNLIGSIVNLLALYCYLIEMGYEINPDLISVLGDDSVLATNANFSLEHFSTWALEKFGMTVSTEKSEIFSKGQPVYFLGALLDSNGRYCNPELLLYQISTTTSDLFLKCNNSLEHADRIWDKMCSVCFKYSDGYKVFESVWPYVEDYLGVNYFKSSYTEIYSRATVPGSDDPEIGSVKDYWKMRTLGWFFQ
jgi:hypothetical protein